MNHLLESMKQRRLLSIVGVALMVLVVVEVICSTTILNDVFPLSVRTPGIDKTIPTHVTTWDSLENMHDFLTRFYSVVANDYCRVFNQRHSKPTTNVLRIAVSCKSLFEDLIIGSGNIISALYSIRLAVHVFGADRAQAQFYCSDAEETKTDLVLPWMMGKFTGESRLLVNQEDHDTWIERGAMPTKREVCNFYTWNYIGQAMPAMRYDFRKMAIALLGIPPPDHPSHAASVKFAQEHLWQHSSEDDNMQLRKPLRTDLPLLTNVTLDDTVVHWRCGDILEVPEPTFSFAKFTAVANAISPNVRSIGILTQPFKNWQHQTRSYDMAGAGRCYIVVKALKNFLKDRFRGAKVYTRNGPGETIALAYARMVMANQTISATTSTFGVFPSVATFGTAYVRRPNFVFAPNRWLVSDPYLPDMDKVVDNLFFLEEKDRMDSEFLKTVWDTKGKEEVLEWFRNDEYRLRKPWVRWFLVNYVKDHVVKSIRKNGQTLMAFFAGDSAEGAS